MKIFGLKNCDTCRKAMKALPDSVLVDVRAEGVPDDIMAKAMASFGASLVNTRSTTWRGLSDSDRARPSEDLLREHPALMKRPLILDDEGRLHLGWTAETRANLGIA